MTHIIIASNILKNSPSEIHWKCSCEYNQLYLRLDANTSLSFQVVQRRHDGSVIFQRDWMEYKVGFGFLSQEFWLGNEKLSFLTNQKEYELRIDFTYADGSSFHALYSTLRISDEFSNYRLGRLGQFSGTASKNLFFLLRFS